MNQAEYKKQRILFIAGYLPPDRTWPVHWCGGDKREVDILSYHRLIPFGARFRRIRTYIYHLYFVLYCIWHRKKYDGMVFWDANNGVLFACFVRLLWLKSPRILLYNLIVIHEGGLFRKLVNRMIGYGLKCVNAVTVLSFALAEQYRAEFRWIRDIYHIPGELVKVSHESEEIILGGYIFSGGASLRDWPTLIAAANRLPNEKFVVCASSNDATLKGLSIPGNVTLIYDVSNREFFEIMSRSKFVVVTLLDDCATAGMIVMFNAFYRGKAVIATRTIVTVEHIQDGENGLLVRLGDVDDLVEKIRLLSSDLKLISELGANAQKRALYLADKIYMQKFQEILDAVLEKGNML